jgi:hypothetical protein
LGIRQSLSRLLLASAPCLGNWIDDWFQPTIKLNKNGCLLKNLKISIKTEAPLAEQQVWNQKNDKENKTTSALQNRHLPKLLKFQSKLNQPGLSNNFGISRMKKINWNLKWSWSSLGSVSSLEPKEWKKNFFKF